MPLSSAAVSPYWQLATPDSTAVRHLPVAARASNSNTCMHFILFCMAGGRSCTARPSQRRRQGGIFAHSETAWWQTQPVQIVRMNPASAAQLAAGAAHLALRSNGAVGVNTLESAAR